jgi:hypothetical protein
VSPTGEARGCVCATHLLAVVAELCCRAGAHAACLIAHAPAAPAEGRHVAHIQRVLGAVCARNGRTSSHRQLPGPTLPARRHGARRHDDERVGPAPQRQPSGRGGLDDARAIEHDRPLIGGARDDCTRFALRPARRGPSCSRVRPKGKVSLSSHTATTGTDPVLFHCRVMDSAAMTSSLSCAHCISRDRACRQAGRQAHPVV